MKRVITYGTFDLLHYGHINLLRRAKEQGDYLIVALSTDEFNWDEKQKKCYFSYEKRKQLLEAIRYVDLVIPEKNCEQKVSDVKEYRDPENRADWVIQKEDMMTLINHGYLLPLRADYPGADVLPVFNQADTPQEAALAGEMLEGMGETSGAASGQLDQDVSARLF